MTYRNYEEFYARCLEKKSCDPPRGSYISRASDIFGLGWSPALFGSYLYSSYGLSLLPNPRFFSPNPS
jgi:hypothetical protein